MSLLAQINQRNAAQAGEEQAAQAKQAQELQAQEAEMQKPDATESAKQKRAGYSSAFSSGADQELEEEEAGAEEQEAYTALEMKMVEVINSPAGDKLMKIIGSATDPVEGIGQAAHDLLSLVNRGASPGEDVLFSLGESAVEQLTQAYEDVNPSSNITEDQMAEAFSIGLQEWMQNNPNSVDPDMKEFIAAPPPRQL